MKIKPLLPYLLFAALVCIFLWRPIFKGEALLPGDYLAQMSPWNTVTKAENPPPQWNPLQWDAIAQFYPWRVYYARSIQEGKLPLWNPHQFCGTPFLANGQSAVLYPPNLLFVFLDAITAFTVLAALHLFFAQVFMFWLMRSLGCRVLGSVIGAVCFAFSAFMVLWLELPTLINVAVWLPLVLLLIHRCVERRSLSLGVFAGAALAMSFLAGHLQIAFYVALAAMIMWAWKLGQVWRDEGRQALVRRVIAPAAASFVVAGLIASAQLLPSVELGNESHRVREVTAEGYETFVGNAVKPYRLITALVPDFYGDPSKNTYYLGSAADYIEYGLYVGVMPLVLAGVGLGVSRRRKNAGFFGVIAVMAMLVATGTLLNALFYYLIPGFSAFGGPNRILLLYFFGVAGLAAFGMDWFVDNASARARWKGREWPVGVIAAVGIFLILGAAYAVLRLVAAVQLSALLGKEISFDTSDGASLFAVFAMLSAVLLAAFATRRINAMSFSAIAIALIVVDLFAFGIGYNPTCAREKVYPETALTSELKKLCTGGDRIVVINSNWSLYKTPDAVLPPNAAMIYGLYDAQGYDSLFSRTYKKLSSGVQGEDSSPVENGNMVVFKQYSPNLARLASIIVSREPIRDLALLGNYDGVNVYRVARADEIPPVVKTDYAPNSFKLGITLSLLGIAALSSIVVNEILNGSSRKL